MFLPRIDHRASRRFPAFDYARPGVWFITTVTRGRHCLFGDVVDGVMHLSPAGKAVEATWRGLCERFEGIELDVHVVMPNHFHGVLFNPTGQHLSGIVGAFKSIAAREANAAMGRSGPLWQRSYWDHRIMTERAAETIHAYVLGNPASWSDDRLHPDAPPCSPPRP